MTRAGIYTRKIEEFSREVPGNSIIGVHNKNPQGNTFRVTLRIFYAEIVLKTCVTAWYKKFVRPLYPP